MSVMVVNDETFIKIVSTLQSSRDLSIKRIVDNMSKEQLIQKVEATRKANYDSYNQLYKDNTEMLPIRYSFTYPMNIFQLLKSLECIKYQIEIKDFDYSFIDRLIDIIQRAIIHNLPEYDKAAWG